MGDAFSTRQPRSSGLRVRLTPDERGELDALARVLNLQRSDVIRLGLELLRERYAERLARAPKGGTE